MDVARRFKVGLAACIAIIGASFFTAPALADTQFDPTETNIPYLAWRGEQLRLVKCAPIITGAGQRADYLLVDWSGEENALAIPQLEAGTGGFFIATGRDHLGQGCVGATFSSQKAGIAQIKLVVSALPGSQGNTTGSTTGGVGAGSVGFVPGGNIQGLAGTPVLKHDFLAIWMNLNPPVLSVGNPPGPLGDVPAGGFPTPGADVLTDVAGAGPNNFRVDVTGNVPLRADFRELGLGDTLQLPADWARLAQVMGTYFSPDTPTPGSLWDIHDDRSTAEGHGFQSVCPTYSTGTAGVNERAARFDAVDNCPQLLTGSTTARSVGFLSTATTAGSLTSQAQCGLTTTVIDAPSLTFPGIGGQCPNITVAAGALAYGAAAQGEFGAFSRIWRGPTFPTIGPFDPLKPSETLLSNGVLDANDAPMPAARIDFTTTGGGFFGCVGSTAVASSPGCSTTFGPGGFLVNTNTAAVTAPITTAGVTLPAGTASAGSVTLVQNITLAAGFTLSPTGEILVTATGAHTGIFAVPLPAASLLANQRAKDKHVIYSRNGTGAITAAAPNEHNLYAPFYGRFIPATARANPATLTDPRLPAGSIANTEASGEDGPAGSVLDNTAPTGAGCPASNQGPTCANLGTNNFNGWLVNGLYHYWDVARVLSTGSGANTTCLLRNVTSFTGPGGTAVQTPIFRQNVSGPQTVVVYTDEHGEAHVNWYPGTGFPLFAGLASNLNAGCDLQNFPTLATPTIQAIARYPYQPVTAPPLTSNTFTKTVSSRFSKSIACVPKGPSASDQLAQICVAQALDVTGSPAPFVNEIVCFATNGELIQAFTSPAGVTVPLFGGVTVTGRANQLTPAEMAAIGKSGAAVICERLDANGRAAVEVTKPATNVLVDFFDEGVLRAVSITTGGATTGTTGASEGAAVTSTSAPNASQVAAVNSANTTAIQTNGAAVQNKANSKPEVTLPSVRPKAKYSVVRSDIMTPVNGKSYLVVRVNGPKGTVKVRIEYVGARRVITHFNRTIRTNKAVAIHKLPKITAAVRSIRVKALG